MDEYATNTTWPEIARRINAAERIALITHSKPDGDALGSLLALRRALAVKGKTADIYLMGPLEPALMGVIEDTPFMRVEDAPPDDDYDAIIVADTGARSQLDPLCDWLIEQREKAIVIDHHPRGDDVAALRIIDTGAAAAAQMIVSLLDEMGCEITGGIGSIAEAIYIGIATDTGWFKYQNADAATFELAGRLLRRGVDKSRLYRTIEQNFRPQRLALEARALTSVQYLRDGVIAIQSLKLEDFQETGCTVADLTNIVNLPMTIGSVRISILLSESEPAKTKMSFRAKPGPDGGLLIDMNELASRFGGGGHVFAAGARIDAGLNEALRALREALGC